MLPAGVQRPLWVGRLQAADHQRFERLICHNAREGIWTTASLLCRSARGEVLGVKTVNTTNLHFLPSRVHGTSTILAGGGIRQRLRPPRHVLRPRTVRMAEPRDVSLATFASMQLTRMPSP
jgi:hypothetical protein